MTAWKRKKKQFSAFPSREKKFGCDGNTRLHLTYPKGRDLKWEISYRIRSGLEKIRVIDPHSWKWKRWGHFLFGDWLISQSTWMKTTGLTRVFFLLKKGSYNCTFSMTRNANTTLCITKVTKLLYAALGSFGALSFNVHSHLWKTLPLLISPSETNCKWQTKIIPIARIHNLSVYI